MTEHPDVKRMLLTMKAKTSAARAICYATSVAMDIAHHSPDESERRRAHAEAALLTPVAKAYSTDTGVEVASEGIQVHGGMGYIEETGSAQYYRDARIAPIYEGTNGIQAIDLVDAQAAIEWRGDGLRLYRGPSRDGARHQGCERTGLRPDERAPGGERDGSGRCHRVASWATSGKPERGARGRNAIPAAVRDRVRRNIPCKGCTFGDARVGRARNKS